MQEARTENREPIKTPKDMTTTKTNPKTKANPQQSMCLGCRYNTIKTGKEFICDRPGMTSAKIAEEAINLFFGEPASCNEPTLAG